MAQSPGPPVEVQTLSPPSQASVLLLAQSGSLEGAVQKFLEFLKTITTVIAILMALWAAFLIHDGKIREGLYALLGAFLLLISRLVVEALLRAGS